MTFWCRLFWFGDCILSVWSKKGKSVLFFFGFFRCFYPCFFAVFCTQKIDFLIRSKKNAVFSPKKRQFFQKKRRFFGKKRRFFCVKMSDLKIRQLQRRFFRLKTPWKSRYFWQNKSPFWQNKTAIYPTKTPTYFCKTPFRSTLGLKVRKHSDSVRAKTSPRVSNTLQASSRKGKSVLIPLYWQAVFA